MRNYLPVVHIVDTEGILSEPIKITFKRIYEMFGLRIKPSKLNLKKILLEVNLFNFSGNLYNKSLNVSFYNFIRSEKKFNDHQDLIKQIEKDLKQAKFDLKKNNE